MSTLANLFVDPPASGVWNMAIDEALLASMTVSPTAILRFYQWDKPTLSLGYFQASHDRNQHPASAQADIVRRLSGGGAIVHDQELTYSLVLPKSHPSAQNIQSLYDIVHKTIVLELRRRLPQYTDWNVVQCSQKREDRPFLCFQRRFVGDIVMESSDKDIAHKVVGSAQRRRGGHILQHGSILLKRSSAAPELPGIFELTGVEIEPKLVCYTVIPKDCLQAAYAPTGIKYFAPIE